MEDELEKTATVTWETERGVMISENDLMEKNIQIILDADFFILPYS